MQNRSLICEKIRLFLYCMTVLFLVVCGIAVLAGCTSEEAAVGAAAGLAGVWIFFAVLIWLVVAGAGIFFFVIWLIALIDCVKRENMDFPDATDNTKLIWILVIVLAGGIGAIIYYFVVMRKQPRKK